MINLSQKTYNEINTELAEDFHTAIDDYLASVKNEQLSQKERIKGLLKSGYHLNFIKQLPYMLMSIKIIKCYCGKCFVWIYATS